MTVLVAGGAGSIGSHMVHRLRAAGRDVVVIDDLSTGHRDAVPASVPFVVGGVGDRALTSAVIRAHRVSAIIHFAAKIEAAESIANPRRYWQGNLVSTAALLDSALDEGARAFIFSSTAAVYGTPKRVPITEDARTAPIDPYGESKLAAERVLASYGMAYGLRYAALRYFNACGAHPAAGLGERHSSESHLIPMALDVALGRRPHVTIFGRDHRTPDGTCVRDYIHVLDLVDAHLAALEHLEDDGESGAFNLGTGMGHSVAEVIDMCREVTGRRIPVIEGPRRGGEPDSLVVSSTRAQRLLGWRPARSDLRTMIEDAWLFHRHSASSATRLQRGPESAHRAHLGLIIGRSSRRRRAEARG